MQLHIGIHHGFNSEISIVIHLNTLIHDLKITHLGFSRSSSSGSSSSSSSSSSYRMREGWGQLICMQDALEALRQNRCRGRHLTPSLLRNHCRRLPLWHRCMDHNYLLFRGEIRGEIRRSIAPWKKSWPQKLWSASSFSSSSFKAAWYRFARVERSFLCSSVLDIVLSLKRAA